MGEIRNSAKRILKEYRQTGSLPSGVINEPDWDGEWGSVTESWILLYAVKSILQVRKESGEPLLHTPGAVTKQGLSPAEVDTLVGALTGDLAALRAARSRGMLTLQAVVSLLSVAIDEEAMEEYEIDKLLEFAEGFTKEAGRTGDMRLAKRGLDIGPWDESERGWREFDLIDLGGLRVPRESDLEIDFNMGGSPLRIVAATVIHGPTALQVQAFRSPNGDYWSETRARLCRDAVRRGGEVSEWAGRAGIEIRCLMPVESEASVWATMNVRFIGCDGPGWFLRGVITGAGADPDSNDEWPYAYFERVVVVPSYAPSGGNLLSPASLGAWQPQPGSGPIPLRMPT